MSEVLEAVAYGFSGAVLVYAALVISSLFWWSK